jgi:hypothetical protein
MSENMLNTHGVHPEWHGNLRLFEHWIWKLPVKEEP